MDRYAESLLGLGFLLLGVLELGQPKSQTESDIHAVSFQSTSHGFIVGRQFLTCEFN